MQRSERERPDELPPGPARPRPEQPRAAPRDGLEFVERGHVVASHHRGAAMPAPCPGRVGVRRRALRPTRSGQEGSRLLRRRFVSVRCCVAARQAGRSIGRVQTLPDGPEE